MTLPQRIAARSSKTAVIVVDMQHEFIDRDGLFPVAGAMVLVERLTAFLDQMRQHGHHVIFTAFEARAELPPTSTSVELFGSAAYDAHRGKSAELHPGLRHAGEIVVKKPRQSAFFGTDLDTTLRSLGVETVVICGVTTNVCCLATARDAAARDYRVVFVSDLTATFDLRAVDGGVLPAELVQSVTCAIVAQSIGKVLSAAEAVASLAR